MSNDPSPTVQAVLDSVEPYEAVPRRGLLFILSSPSGAGKTTLSRRMLATDDALSLSVSATTRAPRPGERDGVDYHFVSDDRFAEMVATGAMLEHARVFDHQYGSPRAPVEAALSDGRDVLFDVDWQGAQQIKLAMQGDVASVFILPPSIAALEARLKSRAQDDDETVARRMAKAMDEISHWREYKYVLVNDDLEKCATQLSAILTAERLRLHRRNAGLEGFVGALGAARSLG